MPSAIVHGLSIAYEVIGEGPPWVITPGGRFAKDTPGVRELARAIADAGNRVLVWDRPNCGESSVSFEGASESEMQADTLAALLRQLDLAPAVVTGGSGGSRVSLLTAARHPDVVAGLAIWWISGGVHGLMTLATHYCAGSLAAAWTGGMEAVVALPEWSEVIRRNPENRRRFLEQDPHRFIATMERWMLAYCPRDDQHVPGLPDEIAASISVPALVFRSGSSDAFHTRATSEALADMLPNARLVEPPWGDREWIERQNEPDAGLFRRWPLLAPLLLEWSEDASA